MNTNCSPVVSIIVPIYNGGKYLYPLISNIEEMNGDFFEYIEIILVDDGSIDNTRSICQNLCKQYSNVIYYVKTNGGIASARNYGLKKAKGHYLVFSDQDDKYVAGLKHFICLMEKNHVQVLIADRSFSVNGELRKENKIVYDELCYKEKIDTVLRQLIGGNKNLHYKTKLNQPTIGIPHAVWTCIYDRNFVRLNDIGFNAIVDYEDDWRFTTECLLYADVLFLSNKSFYAWEINASSESHNRKYIDNFFQRRSKAVKWNIEALRQMGVEKNELIKQQSLEDKRTLIWGFYNSGILGRKLCCNETKEIAKSVKCNVDLFRYTEGLAEKLYILLFSLHFYSLAYMINERILHRRYH